MRRYRTEQSLLQPALEEEASSATVGQSSQEAWQPAAADILGKENDVTNPRDAELKMSKEIGRGIMADIVGQEAYMPTKDVSKIYLFLVIFLPKLNNKILDYLN